jgi:hypothetical protein
LLPEITFRMHDTLRQFVTQVLSGGQTVRDISLMGLDWLKEKRRYDGWSNGKEKYNRYCRKAVRLRGSPLAVTVNGVNVRFLYLGFPALEYDYLNLHANVTSWYQVTAFILSTNIFIFSISLSLSLFLTKKIGNVGIIKLRHILCCTAVW